ncbi:tellurite resistance/C4-dicarboxylate transporter family protein [Gordonia sp. ABSL1-1]|uniref:tellurite resistance/C4-dicarboxylate transporter family protein n=1 Tax=Gordonia sp. ABSL1-1 TaxID=3053923 RepID=UPI002573AD78|nr:tellurite resistance/C4-dicarboxylate transporter family protein [Gordonia sp. ABSL1-1]MDL9936678.1 tellurite resistance/C4-dicarboxylate transporter family protein [Gordonia sp. ABSL1-1]
MAVVVENRSVRWIPHARPVQFTFVMATGIVSTALDDTGASRLSLILFWLALFGFAVLAIGNLWWMIGRRAVLTELRAAGFTALALTAAAGVLGAHCAALEVEWAATIFAVIAVVSWVVLGYGVIVIAMMAVGDGTESASRVSGLARVDGTWFLWVVATQSVAVSSAAVAQSAELHAAAVLAALCWCVGLLQLVIVGALVAARLLTVPLRRTDEVAPYWVFMGSSAISVLAGAEVLGLGDQQRLLDPDVVGSVCMAMWSFATWLLPLLVALMIWHAADADNRRFRTPLWSMVFPIGMYGEASRQLGHIRGTRWLETVGMWESWAAFAVWMLVFVGMLGWWVRWCADARRRFRAGRDRAGWVRVSGRER